MSIFSERIKSIEAYEESIFQGAVSELRSAVSVKAAERGADPESLLQTALERILAYYRIKPVWQKKRSLDIEELIDHKLEPYDLVKRHVDVKSDWLNDCGAPMIGILEDGGITALLPAERKGYRCIDPKTGERLWIKDENSGMSFAELIAIHRAFPSRAITRFDVSRFILKDVHRGDLIKFFAAAFAFVLMGVFLPLAGSLISNPNLIENKDDVVFSILLVVLPILLIRLALGFAKEKLLFKTSSKITRNLQAALMARIYSLPVGEVAKFSAGTVSQYVMQVEIVTGNLITGGLSLVVTAVFSIIYLLIATRTTAALIGPSVRTMLAVLAMNCISAIFQYRLSLESFRFKGEESGMTYSVIRGMKKINLAGAKKRAFAKWAEIYKRSAELKYRPPIIVRIVRPLTVSITAAGMLILYSIAFGSGTDVPGFYSFTIAFSLTTAAFLEASAQINELAAALPVFNLIKPILQAQPEIAQNRAKLERFDGRVRFSKISFAYEGSDRKILDGVSFDIARNEYVALVGRSGCGKSTLIKLMLGFESPQAGDIFYSSQPMRSIDLHSLRSRVGVVLQTGAAIKGTIEDNIKLNYRSASDDEVWEAVRLAGLESDVLAMPLGLKTPLPLGGRSISGGQLQKMLIARAIVSKPRLLILDEATSALDNISQKQISDALDTLKCTRLVIAHRLSTIKNCDRILVLNEGRIVEEGTYDALIEKRGFFAELVKNQQLDE